MTATRDVTVQRLEGLLHGLARRPPIRHAIVGLEAGDRSFRWTGTAGETDGEQLRAETPFFFASIDKLFNATVVMKLCESGRLDLEDAVSTYLPRSLAEGLHRMDGIDHSGKLTVRHLLSHTSGLADWLEDSPKGGRSLVDRLLDEGDMALTLEDVANLVRDRLKPHFPPQDPAARRPRVRYSDTNYMLLIAIIEAVTGEPLHQVHERLLLRPLDLRHTYFAGRSQPLGPTPEPAVLRARGRPLLIPRLIRSTWGMYGTAADAMAFLRRLVRNEVFEDPGTLASMQRRWNRFGFPLDRAALRSPGWPIEYGLGIMRFRLPRVFNSMREMPAVLGHTGSTGCWLFFCPQLDMLMTGSVDEVTAGAVPYRVVPEVLRILGSSDREDAR